MSYPVLPPEWTSGAIYSGPGAEPYMAAAAAWGGLAAEYERFMAGYVGTVGVLGGVWQGAAAQAMAGHAAAYVSLLSTLSSGAGAASSAAGQAAAAFSAVYAAITSPAEITVNREILLLLVATNLFGQNTAAIAAAEAQYEGFWARNTAAMNAYAGSSSAATGQLPAAPAATLGSVITDLGTPTTLLGQVNEYSQALLSSAPYDMPTNILSLFAGLWAVSAPDTPLARAMNALSASASAAGGTFVAPAVLPVPPLGPVVVTPGGGRIGGMSVPPSWTVPATQPARVLPLPFPPGTRPYQVGIPVPPAIPVAPIGRSNQQRQREDPEYGPVSTVLPPRHPSAG